MRQAMRVVGLILLLGLILALAGCGPRDDAKRFSGEFELVELAEAPPQLQALFERLKAVPGLHVLEEPSQTYLLLIAGRAEQPGLALEVLEVRKPAADTKEARVLARLRPAKTAAEYPHAVLRLNRARGLKFTARISTLSEEVLDLEGQPITGR